VSLEYRVIFHSREIDGIKPSEQGWMWPEHDNMFEWFAQEIVRYKKAYQTHCRDFNVAIQAGGHCGVYPRVISSVFETVYTFEPDGYSFHCLVNNCQFDNIKKFNCALGGENEMIYQQYRGQHNMGVNYYGRPIEGIEPIMQVRDVDHADEVALVNIPQVRIDDLGLEHCDLIHLDVEGYEGHVIDGAMKTIEKFKPVIFCESIPVEQEEYLKSLGYSNVFADTADAMFKI
jgi:FkbM family methyltransferase